MSEKGDHVVFLYHWYHFTFHVKRFVTVSWSSIKSRTQYSKVSTKVWIKPEIQEQNNKFVLYESYEMSTLPIRKLCAKKFCLHRSSGDAFPPI